MDLDLIDLKESHLIIYWRISKNTKPRAEGAGFCVSIFENCINNSARLSTLFCLILVRLSECLDTILKVEYHPFLCGQLSHTKSTN